MSKENKRAERRTSFIRDIRRKQRNVIWPEALHNSRSIDEFLWKGSSNPSLVQRIGAWLIGLVLRLLGPTSFVAALKGGLEGLPLVMILPRNQ